MILIGSTRIKQLFPDFPREPKDEDYAVENRTVLVSKENRMEKLYNPIICSICTNGEISANQLYTLKTSHLFWDINWEKHMFDVQFLKKKGCVLNKELFYQLYNFWNDIHGKNKRSVLNMSAEDFFNNAVQCEYSHDWLHTLIKQVPTYTKILKDGAEVDVDEIKFNSLTEEEKEDLVREEVYVMAYERYNKSDYRKAYSVMLKKFIISHAPIWEALWIIENYILLHKQKIDFIQLLNEKIKQESYEFERN